MRNHQPLLASLVLGMGVLAHGEQAAECPGAFDVQGIGRVSLVPTGWTSPDTMAYPRVHSNGTVSTTLNSRAYFASTCTPGVYDKSQYLALDLRGKTLIYTTDLSHAGCGCNAALYLTSMRQNKKASECGDYYCDANNVCGASCAEIDIQEGNQVSWHSTLHDSWDHAGLGKGYGGGGWGWSGPRDFGAAEFGPKGRCVDTRRPFEVSVYFRTNANGKFEAMEITLTQHGKGCPLWMSVGDYSGIGELDAALAAGMTPIVSYWSSGDLQWMDGRGADGRGPCPRDTPKDCSEAVRFYNFSVTPAFPPSVDPQPPARAWLRLPALPELPALPVLLGVEPGKVRAFTAGAFAMLGAQILLGLGVWVCTGMRTPRGQSLCDAVSTSPLRRAVAGSSQSLLMLAECGECRSAQETEGIPEARQPSKEGSAGA